jgi:type II secretory pathway component GspD/PulD (secretin)
LKIGVSRNEDRFSALVDILVSRGYLKILMNPSLEVVNGQTASIQAREHIPLQQTFLRGPTSDSLIEVRTEYYDIIDSLKITPHVFANGYIGLETEVQIAAYLTPEGIQQVPIVTERQVTNKDNRIRHGESLIIGGIRKTEKRDVVRGVPILKDIPGLNLLFSGRDFEERAKEIIFILTPTISTGGEPNRDVVEMLRDRHLSPMTQALHEQMLDPLGMIAREKEQERKSAAAAAQQDRETREQLDDLQSDLGQTQADVDELTARALEASARAERAEAEADLARQEAARAIAEAEEAKAKSQATEDEADAGDSSPEEGAQEPN